MRKTGIKFLALIATISIISPTRAIPIADQIDSLFAEYAVVGQPGCAVGLFEGDRTILAKGYGAADLSFGISITPETVFELGSAAKQFTALAILMLESEGRLSRSDHVRKFLSHLPSHYDAVTLDHLIRHTSGIPDYIQLARVLQAPGLAELTRDSALDLAMSVPMLHAPGTDFAYSNTGYLLLADVVAQVSREPFADFLEKRLFAPLGMAQTHVIDPSRPSPKRATYYTMDGDQARDGEWRGRDAPGAWGIRSSIGDMGRYNAALTSKAGLLAQLTAQSELEGRLASGERVTYGAGLFTGSYRNLRFIRHAGRTNIEFMRFPASGHAIALMCNRDDVDADFLAEAIADIFLAPFLAPSPPAAKSAEFNYLIGAYISDTGESISLLDQQGTLVLAGWGAVAKLGPHLLGAGPSTDALQLSWDAAATQAPTDLMMSLQSSRPIRFRRFTAAPAIPASFSGLVGSYQSTALRVTFRVALIDQLLTLIAPDGSSKQLEPLTPGRFAAGNWRVRFIPDGAVATAIEISTSRTPPIQLQRAATGDESKNEKREQAPIMNR